MRTTESTQPTWLIDFFKLFQHATKDHYGRVSHMDELENALSQAAHDDVISVQVLRTIEESPAWDYSKSWPHLSSMLKAPVHLPAESAEKVSVLFQQLKHIEVVSVVLRFMYPMDFGILSPPVASLLCLPPPRDNIAYYLTYLSVLRKLRTEYSFGRIAAVDMGLWSAAHYSYGPNREKYPRQISHLTHSMETDPFFQIVRFENLLHYLPIAKGQDKRIWLRLLAEAMVDRDELAAGLLAARSFDELKSATAIARRILPDDLERDGERDDRDAWRDCRLWRNDAVHETLDKRAVKSFLGNIKLLERSHTSTSQRVRV